MRKILSKTGFSLLELIISSVLVVIVVLGIFSINSVLSNNNQDYGQRYSVKSATQVTLNHILNNASEAIGSGTYISDTHGQTQLDKGIFIGGPCPGIVGDLGCDDSTNCPNTFCIHQAISSSEGPDSINFNPSSPPSYPNSRWLCYTWYPSTDANYPNMIRYCAMTFHQYDSVLYPYEGAASCSSPSVTAGPLYLGTAFSKPDVVFDPKTGWFTITIKNCLNNSDTVNGNLTCNNSGISLDPANNPEAMLSGSVFPAQEGLLQK